MSRAPAAGRIAARLRAVIALLVLAAVLPLGGTAHADPIWRLRTFTARDGLAHDIVRDVLESRDGALWFATMGGLTRYDPARCRYETITDGATPRRQQAMALAEGRDGAIWVATRGGVGRLTGGRWTWFGTRDGLPADELSSVLVDRRGHVWVTPAAAGVARYDGRSWRTFTTQDGLPSGEVSRCAELRRGGILCGVYDRALLTRFDGARWSAVPLTGVGQRHYYVHTVYEGDDGVLWLATRGAGVIRGVADGAGYRWEVLDKSSGMAADRVGPVRRGRDGVLWFGTTDGVSRYDGRSWQTLTRRDGLSSNHILGITVARDGALWFATLGGGASRYGPSRWERLDERSGLASDNVTGRLLLAADGRLWAGTEKGVSVLSGDRWTTHRTGDAALDHVTHLRQTSDGAIWAATRGGARRLAGGRWETFGAGRGPREAVITPHAQARHRRPWVGTEGATYTTDLKGVRWTPVDGAPRGPINDIVIVADAVWLASGNGVSRLAGGRWTRFLEARSASRTGRINSLTLDARGELWAAGPENVYRFDGAAWLPLPPSPALRPGVYSRVVTSTRDGSLWFAVRGLGVQRLRDERWTSYSTTDGLASDTVSDIQMAGDGAIFFATRGGGINRYRQDRDPPQTHVGSATSRSPGLPAVVLEGEDLTITFGGQDVLKDTETRDLVFSWRVDGGRWSPFAPETRAHLEGLVSGKHLFEVRAMDHDLNVDATPAPHRFVVARHWYREPWLLALVAATLLLLLYAAARVFGAVRRERAAIGEEQRTLAERRQFVRLASHELRKPLARLGHRAEMLELPSTLEDRVKLVEYARAIAGDSRALARLVETLLDQARIQEGLQLRRRSGDVGEVARVVVDEFRADPGAERLRLDAAPAPLVASFDPDYLPLALRNLVDNALRYGGDGPVTVAVWAEDATAKIVVRDEGSGIEAADRERIFEPFYRGHTPATTEHSGFGLGLAFARDIARAHDGDLTLLPAERGAAFCLRLPLEAKDPR